MVTDHIIVRDIRTEDRESWAHLFRSYRAFYRLDPDESVIETVWSWLADSLNPLQGLVADRDGAVVGIAHYRSFTRPASGSMGTWLDDLFTIAEHRGSGVGRALVLEVTARATAQQHSIVRWITATDNVTAQRLYEDIAQRTSWVMYERRTG